MAQPSKCHCGHRQTVSFSQFLLLLTLEIDFFFHEDPAYTLGRALPFSVAVASEGLVPDPRT